MRTVYQIQNSLTFFTSVIISDAILIAKDIYLQGISVAPLWDFCKSQFVGVLSASDFILILREVL